MARPRNPDSGFLNIRIPVRLVPFLEERATELGMSLNQYVANLIHKDRSNLGKRFCVLPEWKNCDLARAAEQPPEYNK